MPKRESHVVMVQEVSGTRTIETDRKGRMVRWTATWQLTCVCSKWERTLGNVDADTAYAFAAAHESGQ